MKNEIEIVEKLASKIPTLRKDLAKARRNHAASPSLQTYSVVASAAMALGKELMLISAAAASEITGLDAQLRSDVERDIATLQSKVNPPGRPVATIRTIQ